MTLPHSFLALDFETNKRSPSTARIVEVALARVENGVTTDRWSTLVNPGDPIDPGAQAVHGISAEHVADAPTEAEILGELAGWCAEGLPLVAYNGTTFDRVVFVEAFKRAGLTAPGNEWHDPLPIARRILQLASHKLGHVGSAIGVVYAPGATAHRAMADVDVLVGVTLALRLRQLEAPPAKPQPVIMDHGQAVPPAPFLATSKAPPPPAPVKAIDESPIVLKARAELAPLKTRIDEWIASADAMACENDEDDAAVVNAVITFRRLAKEAEALRQVHTDEIGKVKRKIEADWRDLALNPIDAVIRRLDAKRGELRDARARAAAVERARLEAEAEAIAMAERDRMLAEAKPAEDAGLAALLSGDTAAAMAHAAEVDGVLNAANDHADTVHAAVLVQAARLAPPPVRATMGTARDRTIWHVTVLNPRLVPAAYLSPDVAKLAEAIASANGEIQIPGVMFRAEVVSNYRGK